MTDPTRITVYCSGGDGHPPHDKYIWIYERDDVDSPSIRAAQIAAGMEPQPHLWKPAKWSDGHRMRTTHGPRRFLGTAAKAVRADDLTAFNAKKFLTGTDDLYLKFEIRCKRCPKELLASKQNFREVNDAFDRFVDLAAGSNIPLEMSLTFLIGQVR